MDPQDSEASGSTQPPTPRSSLAWPPPGLERIQGDLWNTAGRLLLGGLVFSLPIILSIGPDPGFGGSGLFGDAWWVLWGVWFGGGLVFAVGAHSLERLLKRAKKATKEGYGWKTVLMVAADLDRDSGFALQGLRSYSVLDPAQRHRVLQARVLAGGLMVGAGIWLSFGVALCLPLAVWGLLSARGLIQVTLIPVAVLIFAAGLVRGLENSIKRKAKKEWFKEPWSEEFSKKEIDAWCQDAKERSDGLEVGVGPAGRFIFGPVEWAMPVVFVAVFLYLYPLLIMTSVGPTFAMVNVSDSRLYQETAAKVESLRMYRLPIDSTLSAANAGAMYHEIVNVGVTETPHPLIRAPEGGYDTPWLLPDEGGENPTGLGPERWARDLFTSAAGGFSSEAEAYLTQVAAHPGLALVERIATAPTLDVGQARWHLPFPDTLPAVDLPLPPLIGMRQMGYAMIAKAALAVAEARGADAERAARVLISFGLLLGDEGPTLMDNLIGFSIAASGGEALAGVFDATGQLERASAMRGARSAIRAALDIADVGPGPSLTDIDRHLPDVVRDPTAVRGVRWQALIDLSTILPCSSLHRMVFGPSDDYVAFLEEVRSELVRWPSEEALFQNALGGAFGRLGPDEDVGLMARWMSLPAGRSGTAGSCAQLYGVLMRD